MAMDGVSQEELRIIQGVITEIGVDFGVWKCRAGLLLIPLASTSSE